MPTAKVMPTAKANSQQQYLPPGPRASLAGTGPWRSRVELVVLPDISGDAARRAGAQAERRRARKAFDVFIDRCTSELRPLLEASAEILRRWGLYVRVTQTLQDHPAALPRVLDLSLWIERVAERGPGRLTVSATESCDLVRVTLTVGPTCTGELHEHAGTTVAGDLSETLLGGLVATLVERVFDG